ncbi:MAG TPA: phytoene desaturase family protein [Pyrinomonadaceae bacterium]|nr:phytoene desaturase family protein [Pyrinomonadaceae bacterium]
MTAEKRRAVVIGGGLGGLATAVRLAAGGWRVEVCEQGATFGGKMNTHEREGFRFDTGPSLITMPWVFEELFASAGARLSEHLELTRVSPLAEYVFADGARLTYTTSLPEWLETVRRLEPRDVEGFLRFMRLGASIYELSRETFLRRPVKAAPDLRALKALRRLPLRRAWGNYQAAVNEHFRSPHLRQLFGRYPTYVGSSPYKSPATLAVIPFIEYAYGGWHVRGGLYRIVESLVALARRLGVTLHHDARVQNIEHENGRVRGVKLACGTRLAADVVVMNGDASTTNALLDGGLSHDGKPAPGGDAAHALPESTPSEPALPESERSLSGFVLLLGLKRKLPSLAHHTIYFSSDYAAEFSQLFGERRFPRDPTVYVCAPSRADASLAPAGGETLFVMANAPASSGWDERKIEEARASVFERLSKSGFPCVECDAVVSDVWTPERLGRAYLCPGGAIYGTHSHGWRRAFLRPPNKSPKVAGLYHVGGGSHPGGGTPTVLLSARITCELIGRHEG